MIAESHFSSLASDPDVIPVPDSLGFPNGNKHDLLIVGWTKFGNEVLKPKEALSPDFVKALMATESSFNISKDQKSFDGDTRGLIQVTESTRKILQNCKGELKSHHIELSVDESRDPVTNVAAGIRWLHHKKFLLERRLKRQVSWEEVIFEYKGLTKYIGRDKTTDRIVNEIKGHYKTLREKRK